MKHREESFDIAKGLAMLGVIMVHFPKENRLFSTGISFHIATFFAITGALLLKKTNTGESIKIGIEQDIKRLIYPYISLSITYLLFHFPIYYFVNGKESALRFLSENLFLTASFLGIGTLWFLPVMFFARVGCRYILRLDPKRGTSAMILLGGEGCIVSKILYDNNITSQVYTGSLSGYLVNILILLLETLIAIGIMGFGAILWNNIEKHKINKNKNIVILLYSCTFMLLNLLVFETCFAGNHMHNAKMVNSFGYYVCSFLGVISIILLSIWLSQFKSIVKLLSYFGKNSLVIMTTHLEYHVVIVSLSICLYLFGSGLISSILSFALVCFVEMVICCIVNRTPINCIYQYDKLKMLIKKHRVCITPKK